MQTNRNSYNDVNIDFEGILTDSGLVGEMFHLQDLKSRKLYLTDEICQGSVADIVRHILQYNADDRDIAPENRKPILLYVTSPGGEVDSGFELIDAIQCSKTPVYTVNLGYQYSMGFLIGLAGHKRYATRHAKYLHHDGTNIIIDSGTKAKDRMEFQDKVEDRIKSYVLSRTKVTEEEYCQHMRQEWYLFADEAKEYGMVDYIIGVDCDIDSVI